MAHMTKPALRIEQCLTLSTEAVINASDGFTDCVIYTSGPFLLKWTPKTRTESVCLERTATITAVANRHATHTIAIADNHEAQPQCVLWDMKYRKTRRSLDLVRTLTTMDFSKDGRYLSALEKADSENNQRLLVWDLFEDRDSEPYITGEVESMDTQTCVKINHENPMEFITNGPKNVLYWRLKADSTERALEQRKGSNDFRTSDGREVATATSQGDVVLWKSELSQDKSKWTFVACKSLNVHPGCISVMQTKGRFLVVGGSHGSVSFLDAKLKLHSWADGFEEGRMTSISFCDAIKGNNSASDSDFVVAIESGAIYSSAAIEDGAHGRKILKPVMLQSVTEIAVHPKRPLIATLNQKAGLIQLLNSEIFAITRCIKIDATKGCPTCLRFFRDGSHLCVGFDDGKIIIYDAELQVTNELRNTKSKIKQIQLDATCRYLAGMTESNKLLLYKRGGYNEERWDYRGQKTFNGAVKETQFVEDIAFKTHLLVLLSEGRVIELHVERISGDDVQSTAKADFGIECLALMAAPPLKYYETGQSAADVIVAGVDGKLRQRSVESDHHVFTHLSPLGDLPVAHFGFFHGTSEEMRSMMWYTSSEGDVGVTEWSRTSSFIRPDSQRVTPDGIYAVHLTSDGQRLIVISNSGHKSLWRLQFRNIKENSQRTIPQSELFNEETFEQLHKCYALLNEIDPEEAGLSLSQLRIALYGMRLFPTRDEFAEMASEFVVQSRRVDDKEWSGRVSWETFLSLFRRYWREENPLKIQDSFDSVIDGSEEIHVDDLLSKLDSGRQDVKQETLELLKEAGLKNNDIGNPLDQQQYISTASFLKWIQE